MSRSLSILPLICSILMPLVLEGASDSYDGRYGLTRRQSADELPRPLSASQPAARRHGAKSASAVLTPAGNLRWQLTDGWELAESDVVEGGCGSLFSDDYNRDLWHRAVVPGTVLTSLVEDGVYPDPYYGLNNLAIPDSLCRKEWWYRIAFDSPEGFAGRHAELCFDGINYRADVWLNCRKLGTVNGAFARGVFDVSGLLRQSNVLAVKIYPPNNPGIPHEQSAKAGQGHNGGVLCLDGPTFISSEGWDWIPGIRDRNIGIWQPVTLRYVGDVRLGDTRVLSDLPLPDTSYADLTVNTIVENRSDKGRAVRLTAAVDGEKLLEKSIDLGPGERRRVSLTPAEFASLRIENPALWWPNGYGEQALHWLDLAIEDAGVCLDSQAIRFGICEYSYIVSAADSCGRAVRFEFSPVDDLAGPWPFDSSRRQPAADGGVVIPALTAGFVPDSSAVVSDDATAPYLVICCNGERIFCRGGNWGMDDGMKRVSRRRLEPALRLHREQGFNMIRNWTGETTEEEFYQLCDEYGIMVWNDFWLSTQGANLEPVDEDLFMANATETVRRFRNHPSIAVWCPRNEGYAPRSLDARLVELITDEDGTRYYSPNSRYMNLRTSGPWHYLINQDEYALYHAKGFTTELGTPALPTAESMRKFIPESECWPISDTWHYHDLHGGLPHYCNTIDSLFGPSESLDEFCAKAQIINYNSLRTMFEAWNGKMWNSTTGMLLWMSHPAWPSVEWQTYTWDLETPGAYFGSKKACEPRHIQLNPTDSTVSIINNSREGLGKGYAVVRYIDARGRISRSDKVAFTHIDPNTATTLPYSLSAGYEPFMLRLELYAGGRRLSVNDYILEKHDRLSHLNTLGPADVDIRIKEKNSRGLKFEVRNTSAIPAIAVKFNIRHKDTGEALLPAYFSDGYINLLPGEARIIDAEYSFAEPLCMSAEGFNLPMQIFEIQK